MTVMTLTVLGCGSSSGAPVIGCSCPVCRGGQPENIRARCAAWLEANGRHFIIDTGTDFRAQVLRFGVPRVDAVLYTHAHADHLNGIDDLRAFCYLQKQAIEVFGNEETVAAMRSRFDYAFLPPGAHWNRPVLLPRILAPGQTVDIFGVPVVGCDLAHGRHGRSRIYRLGNIAWLTDIGEIDEEAYALLENLDVLFIDCLMDAKYPNHLSVAEATAAAQRINAKQTYFIHMTHLLDYFELKNRCPPRMAPAYDGLVVRSEFRATEDDRPATKTGDLP